MAAIARRGRSRRGMSEINVVPFIDVMLVLLVIFMVTAPMVTPGVINAPKVGSADQTPPVFAQVHVATDGTLQWEFEGVQRAVTLDEVGDVVKAWQDSQMAQGKAAEQIAVVIVGDKQANYEHVMNAMGALQGSITARVAFLVNRE
ncbi:hypothetical protein AAV94_11200 [Lampropedia cohaerens]|uniref:Biopolymer transporter ExbD n=2 Tax=Lampropedia cohaerens TaxID=1610491 RepID=A0A0U1PY58_9BURK|nr:biopolymer transporter ExbD [Lampropedia cohaerens]KKW67397.1 hypothetical protein AAV94_11200 [Lampropedia cohaerens]